MRNNSASVYPSQDLPEHHESRRSTLAVDINRRIRLFRSANALDFDYDSTDRGRSRRITVAGIPESSSNFYDNEEYVKKHRSVTELKDFQFYQESPYRKNNGKRKSQSSEEIFLEDIQDEVSVTFFSLIFFYEFFILGEFGVEFCIESCYLILSPI